VTIHATVIPMKHPLLKHLSAPLLVALTLAWVGCEGSPVPLSESPSVPVDSTWLGAWELENPDENDGAHATVYRFNAFEYLVDYREVDTADDGSVTEGDSDLLRMFVTDVDGRPVLNLICIDCGDDEDWFFLEVEMPDPDRALLTPPADDFYEGLDDDVTPQTVLNRLRAALEAGRTGETGVFRRMDG